MQTSRYVDITKSLRPVNLNKYFHCTFVFKGSNLLKIGINNYKKIHPYHKYGMYISEKESRKYEYHAGLHSEVDAIIKLGKTDCSDFSFLNIGLTKAGELTNSRPCTNCQRVLEQVGYKKIIFYNKQTKTWEKF